MGGRGVLDRVSAHDRGRELEAEESQPVRKYNPCPESSTRMAKIDDSEESFGDPPTPAIGWYVCPNEDCFVHVKLYRQQNVARRGFHPDDYDRFVRDGKMTPSR